jgi:restriction system protein
MDLISIFLFIVIFLIALGFLSYLGSPKFKGKLGESIVSKAAGKYLDEKTYQLIDNVTLIAGDGTTQIDHIIVSIYGVFVIETKNMKGWIFGSEKQKTWTQVIFKDKYKFQNPLRQNYKHVKVLQNLLKLRQDQFFSIIVFIGDCEIKTDLPDNVTVGLDYIDYILNKSKRVLTDKEVEITTNIIQNSRMEDSKETDNYHIQNLRNNRSRY